MLKKNFLFVAAIVVPLLAGPAELMAEPLPVVIYQNDFTTRTSTGPIGGEYTYDYALGNLVSHLVQDVPGQDTWIRRNSHLQTGQYVGVTVDAGDSNPFVRIGTNWGHTHVIQKFGTSLSEGPLRMSVDIRPAAPLEWQNIGTRGLLFWLGGDAFYDEGTSVNTAASFGVIRDGSENRFVARDGDGNNGATNEFGTATIDSNKWYRFIADVDLNSNSYSVIAYDMGTTQPTPSTPLGGLVFSASDLGFRNNIGSASVPAISTVGFFARGVTSSSVIAGFDNIVLSVPEPSSWLLLAFGGLSLAVFRRKKRQKAWNI